MAIFSRNKQKYTFKRNEEEKETSGGIFTFHNKGSSEETEVQSEDTRREEVRKKKREGEEVGEEQRRKQRQKEEDEEESEGESEGENEEELRKMKEHSSEFPLPIPCYNVEKEKADSGEDLDQQSNSEKIKLHMNKIVFPHKVCWQEYAEYYSNKEEHPFAAKFDSKVSHYEPTFSFNLK